jgi:hypothetical protein
MMASGASPPIAVAPVAWSTEERLGACLRSLAPDVEAGLAETWIPGAGDRPASFAAAANAAARDTTAPWLAVADVDVVVRPGALEHMLKAGVGTQRVAVVAPQLARGDGSISPSVRPFPGVATALRHVIHTHAMLSSSAARREVIPYHWDPERPRRVPWAYATFLLVRREALEAVGGFDEQLPEHAVELDLCWRLARAGWVTRYEPRAVVEQQAGTVPRQAFGERGGTLDVRPEWTWIARRKGLGAACGTALVGTLHSGARTAVLGMLASRDPERWGDGAARAREDVSVKLRAAGDQIAGRIR